MEWSFPERTSKKTHENRHKKIPWPATKEDEHRLFLTAKSLAEKCSYRLADMFDNIFLVSLAKTTLLTPRFDFGWHIPSFGSLLVEDNWHALKSLGFTFTFLIDLPQVNFLKETKSLKRAANVEKRRIALGITPHADVPQGFARRSYPTNEAVTRSYPTKGAVTCSYPTKETVTRSYPTNGAVTRSYPTNETVTRSYPTNGTVTCSYPTNGAVTRDEAQRTSA